MTRLIYSRLCLYILFVVIFLCNPKLTLADSIIEKENISLKWAFGALVGPENNRKLIRIVEDTTLKTGDQLKMMINKKSECFVYLVYHGSNGDIMSLFPFNSKQLNNNINKIYYIPKGNAWFTLDENTGNETFHLIASEKRLQNLECLINKYQVSTKEEKSNIGLQIIKEIKSVKRMHKNFTAKVERPIPIAGSIRSSEDQHPNFYDILPLAVEITATTFYGRTFTIEHK